MIKGPHVSRNIYDIIEGLYITVMVTQQLSSLYQGPYATPFNKMYAAGVQLRISDAPYSFQDDQLHMFYVIVFSYVPRD